MRAETYDDDNRKRLDEVVVQIGEHRVFRKRVRDEIVHARDPKGRADDVPPGPGPDLRQVLFVVALNIIYKSQPCSTLKTHRNMTLQMRSL